MNHPSVFLTLQDFAARSHGNLKSFDHNDKIVHCINPFTPAAGSEHELAQATTIRSMSLAQAFSKTASPDLNIHLVSAVLEADVNLFPNIFEKEYILDRTIQDLAAFNVPRPLPLICDILKAVDLNENDILIYTNVDIALMPGFYSFIEEVFGRGFDCAIINRRTISEFHTDPDQISAMYADIGETHNGFDCFAFRAHLRDKMIPFKSCLGIAGVMRPLLHNLLAFSDNPVVFLDAHETFHIGNDSAWSSDRFQDYSTFNRSEIARVFDEILQDSDAKSRLVTRLQGCSKRWVFSDEYRKKAGLKPWPRDFDVIGRKNSKSQAGRKIRKLVRKIQNRLR